MKAIYRFVKLIIYYLTIYIFVNFVIFLGCRFSNLIGVIKGRCFDQQNTFFKEYFCILEEFINFILVWHSRNCDLMQKLYAIPIQCTFWYFTHYITNFLL